MRKFKTPSEEIDLNGLALSDTEYVYSMLSANLLFNRHRLTMLKSVARHSEVKRQIDIQETALAAYGLLHK